MFVKIKEALVLVKASNNRKRDTRQTITTHQEPGLGLVLKNKDLGTIMKFCLFLSYTCRCSGVIPSRLEGQMGCQQSNPGQLGAK